MAETLTMLEKAGKERILTPDGDIDRHFLLEVLKRVFADREAFVTDPDYMKVDPASLLDASLLPNDWQRYQKPVLIRCPPRATWITSMPRIAITPTKLPNMRAVLPTRHMSV